MIWLKTCPRCGGDLYEETVLHEREILCLQCSRSIPLSEIRAVLQERTEQRELAGEKTPVLV